MTEGDYSQWVTFDPTAEIIYIPKSLCLTFQLVGLFLEITVLLFFSLPSFRHGHEVSNFSRTECMSSAIRPAIPGLETSPNFPTSWDCLSVRDWMSLPGLQTLPKYPTILSVRNGISMPLPGLQKLPKCPTIQVKTILVWEIEGPLPGLETLSKCPISQVKTVLVQENTVSMLRNDSKIYGPINSAKVSHNLRLA